jgi:hypothetical protein
MVYQSIAAPKWTGHRFIWTLQCDECGHTSEPSWTQHSLGLFRIQGWDLRPAGLPTRDLCPTCKLELEGARKRDLAFARENS